MADPWWHSSQAPRSRSRAYTVRGVRNACVALAVVALAGLSALTPASSLTPPVSTSMGVRTTPASVAALAAGCGPVQEVVVVDSAIGSVDIDTPLGYQTRIPVAGWFASSLPGSLTGTPEEGVHALWQGQRIVWLPADTTKADLERARDTVARNPGWRAVVLVWDLTYPTQLASDEVAIATWGRSQVCTDLSERVVDELLTAPPPSPGRPGQIPPRLDDTTNGDHA